MEKSVDNNVNRGIVKIQELNTSTKQRDTMPIQTERYGYETCGKESAENRYAFDFDLCSVSKGWAQIDTTQDASYFGNWAHPEQFKIVSYAEGDTTIETADTLEEFKQILFKCVDWNKSNGYWRGIDPGLNKKNIQAWIDLGFKSLIH